MSQAADDLNSRLEWSHRTAGRNNGSMRRLHLDVNTLKSQPSAHATTSIRNDRKH